MIRLDGRDEWLKNIYRHWSANRTLFTIHQLVTMAVIIFPCVVTAFVLLSPFAACSNRTGWFRRVPMQTPFPEVRMRHMRHSGLASAEAPLLWPVKKESVVEGDLLLGGLMMVHSREDTQFTCGPIMAQGGIQAVEMMLFTLDQINKQWTKFNIGALILDDCDKDTYGLEMAIDFIKGQFQKYYYYFFQIR